MPKPFSIGHFSTSHPSLYSHYSWTESDSGCRSSRLISGYDKSLNQAVKRNYERFLDDFMFQLSDAEAAAMRSQFVTGSKRNIKYQPLAFTEHGVSMLSSVLRSERAVQMSIAIIRAFVHLREMIATHKDLAERIGKLEDRQYQTTSIIDVLVDEIDGLAREVKHIKVLPSSTKQKIGFDL